ncbi:MAG TPA: glucosamine-6-phosphate deaminase [bacterium]|nr:glucosamine-6-phosphate deaminase [bacterium]HNS48843.1 glucosamine-6-phosphate deaminase [bacterium]
MQIIIKTGVPEMSRQAARIVKARLQEKPDLVLGLATGSTPLGLYQELIRLHREEGLDFSRVTTFNLDEYLGLPPEHPQSYNYFMWEHLFSHINIRKKNVHLPDGRTPYSRTAAYCREYEERIVKAGGIDLQILGIGRDGHIGFNEPGSALASRTHVKTLTEETIQDNARFFADPGQVPLYAITMGVGTVMDAREIILLANGANKADAIYKAIEDGITCQVTASILQFHPKATFIIDEEAASLLQRKSYYKFVAQAVEEFERRAAGECRPGK